MYVSFSLYIVMIPPSIETPPQFLTIRVGDPLNLTCTVTGRPPPQVEWFKDGVSVGSVGSVIDQYTVSEMITVVRSSANESGSYTCTAINTAGNASYSVQVSVTGKTLVMYVLSLNTTLSLFL